MSTLATFLQAKEPLFDHALVQLEQRSGHKGVDVALVAEIAEKVASHVKQLGLDHDYTGRELYGALVARIKTDNEHLAVQIGGSDEADVQTLIPLIEKAALAAKVEKNGYFIKLEVASDILKQHPPQGIMTRLGYDNVESLLANEDLQEVYLALRFAETPDWLTNFNRSYGGLKSSDFEERDIRLIRYDNDKWGDIADGFIKQKFHNITNSKEIGAIAMMPLLIERMPGITLKDLPLIFHYYNEIRLYSAYFKLLKDKKNFGEIVGDTLVADPTTVSVVAGTNIHWRVIQRYFGKHPDGHPEIFEPHVQPEDLHWRKAEDIMFEVDPELEFWRGTDYLAALVGKDTVTLNILDVAFGYSNTLSYEDRYVYHFRESLWNEVFARYMGEKTLEDQILHQLDNDVIMPENLKIA